MRKLLPYDVSDSEFKEIKTKCRNNEFRGRKSNIDYVTTARAMIWLEEMEQSKVVKMFNQKNVQLIEKFFGHNNRIYCFRNDVSFDCIDVNVI